MWDVCIVWMRVSYYTRETSKSESKRDLSPLHFATLTGLVDEAGRLRENGVETDTVGQKTVGEKMPTPLQTAICIGNGSGFQIQSGKPMVIELSITCYAGDDLFDLSEFRQWHNLEIIKMIIEFGSYIDLQLMFEIDDIVDSCKTMVAKVTPLTAAILCRYWKATQVLLEAGAAWDIMADMIYPESSKSRMQELGQQDVKDLCSIRTLLDEFHGSRIPSSLPQKRVDM